MTASRSGLRSRVSLRLELMRSFYCRTAIMDGQPVAIWGAKGMSLSSHAVVWLALTDRVTSFPVSVVREARRALNHLLDSGMTVSAEIDSNDSRAMKFARALGFKSSDKETDGMVEMELS